MTKEEIKDLLFTTVHVRDSLDQKWIEKKLIGYLDGPDKLFITESHNLNDASFWNYMRPIPEMKRVAFDKRTAPRYLEVEIDGALRLCTSKDEYGATFDGVILSWDYLMGCEQWDGSPCYLEVLV